jgi:hypothetical protein
VLPLSAYLPNSDAFSGTFMTANQVTPFGSIESAPTGFRGLLMGNRGVLLPRHYDMPRPYAIKPWITCVLKDKSNQPIPKSDVKYTRLFFLDEVTAFAAGHRPCGQCQKKRYIQFVDIWCKANLKDSKQLDEILHIERTETHIGGAGFQRVAMPKDLPSGTFVRLENDRRPHLLLLGKLFPWAITGYAAPTRLTDTAVVQVLTPASIVKTFQAGFPLPINSEVTVHSSVLNHFVGPTSSAITEPEVGSSPYIASS